MTVAADIKEAKYTQGFCFQQDDRGQRSRSRQVVERSCTALMTLLQELFVQAERQLSGQLTGVVCSETQRRLLEQLAEIVRARAVVERVTLTSVVCAFAAMEDRARGHEDNRPAILQALEILKEQTRETEDLMSLLGVREKISVVNNSARPLLFHLNAQWVVLFGLSEFRLQNSPLGPATLAAGFVAGLSCVKAGLGTRRLLFQMFEQYVLARLSMLLNSITLRLEEEGIEINRAVSFDELDAGPIQEVLEGCRPIDTERMQMNRQRIRDALSRKNKFMAVPAEVPKALDIYLKDESVDTYADLLGELTVIRHELEPAMLRADIHQQETASLIAIRRSIVEQLNQQLAGKSLPGSIREFFSKEWPDVLFQVAVSQDSDGNEQADVLLLQEQLLKSVSPVDSEEQRRNLSKVVPAIVKSLREHLEQAGYSLAETTRFFTQLKQLHLANVQAKLETTDFLTWQPLSPDGWVPVEKVMVSDADRDFYDQLRAVVG